MQYTQKPEVRFGEWISEGWKMFSEQWQAWVLQSLIFFLIVGTPVIVVIVGFYAALFSTIATAQRTPNAPPDIGPELLFGFYGSFFIVWIFALVASCFFTGGMHLSAIKQLQGGKVEVRDLFSGARYFFPVLGATILVSLLTAIGSMLCIVPGFLVAGCLFFTMPLILHRRLGVIEAMQTSYDLTKQNIWMFALFAFVAQLIAQAGAYAMYIGLLATFPLLFTITAVAYRDMFGVDGARYFRSIAPPPGYGQPYAQPYSQPYPPYAQPYPPQPPMNYQQPGQWGTPPPPMGTPPVNPTTTELPMNNPPSAVDIPQAPTQAPTLEFPSLGSLSEEPLSGGSPSGGLPSTADQAPPMVPTTVPTDQIVPPKADEITAAPSGLVCSQCQKALPPNALFCPRCGTHTGQ